MTNVLIAVDESDEAVAAAESAHKLFGDDAKYFVVNVSSPTSVVPFADGYAFPVAPPYSGVAMFPVMSPALGGSQAPGSAKAAGDAAGAHQADNIASGVAQKADLPTAATIGEVGDPAESILSAAGANNIDVIVVGSHQRSWFTRLLSGSVTDQVVKQSTIPVLVIK